MKIIYRSVYTILIFFLASASVVKAETIDEQNVLYNMDEGGTQTFEIFDENEEKTIIEIEEINSTYSINNGTYKISKKRPLQWEVSYYIDVKNNKITRAHSPSATAFLGSFTSTSLRVDNSKQATYYLKRKVTLNESQINVREKLTNNSISVTY